MMRFVEKSNLPLDCSLVIICDKYCNKFRAGLDALQIQTLQMPENPFLLRSVSYHTDLSVFHGGGKALFLSSSLRGSGFADDLQKIGAELRFFSAKETPEYPGDVQGNICCLDRYYIHNPATADPEIIRFLADKGFVGIPVRQGYARCSVCVVNESSIITEDRKIAWKAEKAGIDALLIDPGYVQLNGYKYGFIGGATFKASRSILCFTGVLERFPQKEQEQILTFLKERNIQPYYLTEDPLFDIGGAVPLIER